MDTSAGRGHAAALPPEQSPDIIFHIWLHGCGCRCCFPSVRPRVQQPTPTGLRGCPRAIVVSSVPSVLVSLEVRRPQVFAQEGKSGHDRCSCQPLRVTIGPESTTQEVSPTLMAALAPKTCPTTVIVKPKTCLTCCLLVQAKSRRPTHRRNGKKVATRYARADRTAAEGHLATSLHLR